MFLSSGLLRLQTVVEENHEADRKYKLAKFDLIHHSKDVVKKKNIFQTFSLIHWHKKTNCFCLIILCVRNKQIEPVD